MVEDGRRLASMDFYDIITSFCRTKMLVVESFFSKDDSTIVNLFFSEARMQPSVVTFGARRSKFPGNVSHSMNIEQLCQI